VNQSLTRAVAIGAVCAAALAGSVATGPTATAEGDAARKGITKFGYHALAFGTKVSVNGVEVKAVKDALARQQCTRQLRGEVVKASSLSTSNIVPDSVPAAGIIQVSPSTSRTKTYRTAKGEYGVRGVNTIGDIKVGGLFEGVQTPVLKVEALQSVADSWNNTRANNGRGKFHAAADFGFGDISLTNLPAEVPQEVEDLLEIIQDDLPIADTVDQIIDLLESVGVIEIPGLGSLALGRSIAKAGAHSARANAYALKVTVQPEGTGATVLQLGRAHSRISDGVPSAVFRSQMSALDLRVGDVVTFGNVSTQTIPCEGTRGKVQSKRVATAGIPGVIDLDSIRYSWMGKQLSRGRSKSWQSTEIGRVDILNGEVVVRGLSSRLDLRSPGANEKVERSSTVKAAQILIGGKAIPIPKPGEEVSFDGGSLAFRKLQRSNYNGTDLHGLVITLFKQNLIVSLGEASGRIWYR
jgi:hypothetical protein